MVTHTELLPSTPLKCRICPTMASAAGKTVLRAPPRSPRLGGLGNDQGELPEKGTAGLELEGGEGASSMVTWKKTFPVKGTAYTEAPG